MGLTYEQAVAVGVGHLHPDAPGNRIVAAACPLPEAEPKRSKVNVLGQTKGEALFDEHLRHLLRSGLILAYWFEPIALRLAGRTFYRPDFLVEREDDSLVALEYKGGPWRDDAKVKSKAVVERFPWLSFFVVYPEKSAYRFHPVTVRGGVSSRDVGQAWLNPNAEIR